VTARELRAEYEALQAREKSARALLASAPALHDEEGPLAHEVENLERALLHREHRQRQDESERPVSQRVAAFGFQVLFIAPIVAMLGITIGRRLRNEAALAVLLLAVGGLVVLAWGVRPVRHALLRSLSPEWRFVRRTRRKLGAWAAATKE